MSSGSGFFVSKVGHVIEDFTSIRVFVNRAEPVDAHLAIGLTPIRVPTPRAASRLGESVAAFGYPHADILATSGNFTQGNVTALAGIGDDSRYLQIATPV